MVETPRDGGFQVRLDDRREVIARAAGKMGRGRRIRITPGDRLDLELSIYDSAKGRVVWRHK